MLQTSMALHYHHYHDHYSLSLDSLEVEALEQQLVQQMQRLVLVHGKIHMQQMQTALEL